MKKNSIAEKLREQQRHYYNSLYTQQDKQKYKNSKVMGLSLLLVVFVTTLIVIMV